MRILKNASRLICFIIIMMINIEAHSQIRYVKPVATGTGDGSSWANASSDLQLMINQSAPNNEVWVATGTYLPNRRVDDITGPITMNNRDNAFMLKVDVKIYGGFIGTETLLSQRNWVSNQTVLSGDIGTPVATNDNCYHVVVSAGNVGNASLDGFTVTRGTTSTNTNLTNKLIINSQDIYRYRGGGIFISGSSPNIINCNFILNIANGGGGVYVAFTPSPTFYNCSINQNTAPAGGAGVFNVESNPQYINCIISNNTSAAGFGGGVFNFKSPSTIINTLVYENSGSFGGGVMNEQSNATFINCTVSENNALSSGGGVANLNAVAPFINNSIIWGNTASSSAPNIYISASNPTVNNSIVQGGWLYAGANNIASNPSFEDVSTNDYRLQICSPAINAGNNSLVPVTITTDLDANPRIVNTLVDIGAYESSLSTITAVPNGSGVIFVDHTKSGNGSSWANAMTELADALLAAKYNNAIQQIWVAKGTYKPKYKSGGSGACDDPNNRYNAFVLKSGVGLYGGFDGSEVSINQRDWLMNETILSGDIGVIGNQNDNSFHVVISAGSGTQILDGFVITKGHASLNSEILVNNVTVGTYRGGGVAISSASPTINNCRITENYGLNGGGMSVIGSNPEINNCIFTGNRAQTYGGAIDHFRDLTGQNSATIINNSHFSGNRSMAYGGAFVNTSPSTMVFNNSTITGNYANVGGALYGNIGSETFNNSIIWDNIATTPNTNNLFHYSSGSSTASNCIIQGGYPGVNIMNANPAFVNPIPANVAPTIAGDYRLQICSPAINLGNNSLVPVSITTDLDRDPRIVNTTVDVGAYEFQTSNVKAVPNGSGIVFVDHTKSGNGNSWANAVPELADALRAAKSNPSIQQIWVAKGTYYPLYEPIGLSCTPDDNREKTFLLVNNVKVYGGFAGGEATIAGRNFVTNETILSGDVGMLNDTADYVYHVVMSAGAVGTAELNGFTVSKGNASINKTITVNTEIIDSRQGGGIVCFNSSPLINNCVFKQNRASLSGGGVYMYAGTGTTFSNCTVTGNYSGNGGGVYISDVSSLTYFTNCRFTSNSSSNGGGVYVNTSNTRFTNCTVSGNSATTGGGGMYYLASVNASLINCVITGNKAVVGAGVRIGSSAPRFDNCTISANNATSSGGGLYFTIAPASGQPFIYNSIVYGNRLNGVTVENIVVASGGANATPDVYYSNIGAGSAYDNMGNNSGADPLFFNPQSATLAPTNAGNYSLQACSPAINTGNNAYIPGGITTDIIGNSRILNLVVDRGAYEISSSDPVTPNGSGVVFVDKTKSGNGNSWANAVPELADALKAARTNVAVTQIWVAKGTYYPLYHASTLLCNPAINRDKAFVLVNNVKIYGGFEGGETLLTERNPALNETILSGDIGVFSNHNDNAFHVVISAGGVGTAELNGFTIQEGRADSTGNLSINSQNVSRTSGAGLSLYSSSPIIRNCKIMGNSSGSGGGGGIYTTSSGSVFSNCQVTGNNSLGSGGGIFCNSVGLSNNQFYNCTFSGNRANNGGGMNFAGLTFLDVCKLFNCIVYGNQTNAGGLNSDIRTAFGATEPEVRFSTIGNTPASGPYDDLGGNNTVDPLFIDPQSATLAPTLAGDYRLQKCSPVINTGSNSYIPTGNDLDNNPRVAFTTIDRGAYEKTFAIPGGSGILYVNINNAVVDGDGSTWESALLELSDALLAARNNAAITEIWVAKGTYYPLYDPVTFSCGPTDNRTKTFLMVNNVKVYGGFAGGESTIAGRDFVVNETILSGDLGTLNVSSDNAYHVVVSAGAVGTALLDGFTITRGTANVFSTITVNGQPVNNRIGGGVYLYNSTPFISNCIIRNNTSSLDGGGMYAGVLSTTGLSIADCTFSNNVSISGGGFYGTTISTMLTLRDCIFTGNVASNGAGAYFVATVMNAVRCSFSNNTANAGGGGFFIINSVNATINNCLFSGNVAQTGGAVRSAASSPRFNNCTVASNNCTSSGGGLYFINAPASGQPLMYNSIVYGNRLNGATVDNIVTAAGGATATPDVSYSIVENAVGYDNLGNNSTTNPSFISAALASAAPTLLGNYRLQKCSPAINQGSNAFAPLDNDLDNNARVAFTTVDRGAYEKVLSIPSTNGIVYVDNDILSNEGDGSSWSSAVAELADALKAAKTNPAITQIWVANGTYSPLYNATDDGSSLTCPSVNRDNSFVLVNDVKLYGGFAGGETDTTGRNFVTNETILSGDFNKDDVITGSGATLSITGNTENAHHVVISAGDVGSAEINGFTITKGNANQVLTSISVNGETILRLHGGGMYCVNSSPTINNSIFSSNSTGISSSSEGGGIFIDHSNSILTNCNFFQNKSSRGGGAIINSSSIILNNCHFSSNFSQFGGGIKADTSSVQILNCIFLENYGSNNGGGIHSNLSSLYVTYSSFLKNSTSTSGGGIANRQSFSKVENCIFSENVSFMIGGGISNELLSSSIIANCLFFKNSSSNGGAVYNSGGVLINSCTMAENSGLITGGGLYLNGTANILTNSIVWGNISPGQKSLTSNGLSGISNCIIEGGYASGTNIYDTDPLFIDATNNDYRLQPCSPGINTGDNSFVSEAVDLDGNPRIALIDVDLGAYEKQIADYTNSTIWRGYNTNWNNKVNWCGGFIPTDTTNVTIPTGLSNYPVTEAVNAVKNITLGAGTTIGTSSTGSLTVHGSYTNNGSTITNNGTWVMAGNESSQSFPGALGTVAAMNTLEINNANGVDLDKSFGITGTLIPSNGDILLKNNVEITLNSDADATASLGIVESGASISYEGTGAFIVERFINTGTGPGQHGKSWQFLATPANGQTIHQSWQENGTTPAGYGTIIIGTGTGFDITTQFPSLKYYDDATNTWTGVTNTMTPLQNELGYMLFVRGDRSVTTYNAPANVTNLRSKGILYSPTNPAPSISVNANSFQSIGNPYASRIEFSKMRDISNGIQDLFYVWDPTLNGSYGLGGYQILSGITGYLPSASATDTSYYPPAVPSPYLESGQAFFVRGTAGGGSVEFNEQIKATGSRLVNRPQHATTQRSMLFASLFTANGAIADGNITVFEDGFSNTLNDLDAIKMMNAGENFAMVLADSIVGVQAREHVFINDTIFYYLSNLRQATYEFRFAPMNMPANYTGLLYDRFLNTYTSVSLIDSTYIQFDITGDAASKSPTRFILVFKKLVPDAPMRIVRLNATRESDNKVQVHWNVEHELNVEEYVIERSTNGIDYTQLGNLLPSNNFGGNTLNVFIDAHPIRTDMYYRIKAIRSLGRDVYSQVVMVPAIPWLSNIKVQPNPITDNSIHLFFNDQPIGQYKVKMYAATGQLMKEYSFYIDGVRVKQTLQLNANVAPGVYSLFITSEEGKLVEVLKVMVL